SKGNAHGETSLDVLNFSPNHQHISCGKEERYNWKGEYMRTSNFIFLSLFALAVNLVSGDCQIIFLKEIFGRIC
ncbi:hypothetical protein ACJX0J_008812, partial [Zea mays]